jgi:hypothetical protein
MSLHTEESKARANAPPEGGSWWNAKPLFGIQPVTGIALVCVREGLRASEISETQRDIWSHVPTF